MNGAQSLVTSLIAGGLDTCFANPGTSEMHFVSALDEIAGIRCVLGLQENVVTGMADGYWRMARKPAATLLHCEPGLANGFANLHNARRARSGILNIVGDHATHHRPFDAPLTTDTDAVARATSDWVRTSITSAAVAQDGMAALQTAQAGHVATLILPSDASWDPNGIVAAPPLPLSHTAPSPHAIEQGARALRTSGNRVLLLLGGDAALAEGQRLAWQVAQHTGASIMAEYGVSRVERGQGRLPLQRIPYSIDAAIDALVQFDHIVLVGATTPVAFFAYPGKPALLHGPQTQMCVLARPEDDSVAGLRALVEVLRCADASLPVSGSRPSPGRGTPTPEGLARTVAAVIPDQAIVCDESISYGRCFYQHTADASPHDWLHLTGGAIGIGLPLATGASIGAPGRRVLSLQADGSAMYSLQALWTQARERLPCTTVILSNRKYNILIGEYQAVGATMGSTAASMLDISRPDLNWVQLANGLGVEAARATTLEQCSDLMKMSFRQDGPFLIELIV